MIAHFGISSDDAWSMSVREFDFICKAKLGKLHSSIINKKRGLKEYIDSMNIDEHIKAANMLRDNKLDPTKYIILARKSNVSLMKYIKDNGVV